MNLLYYVTCAYGYGLGLLYALMLQNQFTISLYRAGKPLFVARFIGIGLRLGVLFALSALFAYFSGCNIPLLGISIAGGYISFYMVQVVLLWM